MDHYRGCGRWFKSRMALLWTLDVRLVFRDFSEFFLGDGLGAQLGGQSAAFARQLWGRTVRCARAVRGLCKTSAVFHHR